MAMAAIAAGCDSLMVEVHPHPQKALSDGPQSLNFATFDEFITQMAPLGKFFGRGLGIAKGDRVALFLPNIPEFAIAYLGILKIRHLQKLNMRYPEPL